MEPQVEELNCKIIIVGDSGVGKTCIMNRFCKGTYLIDTTATLGVNFESKRLKIFDKMVNMIIWDTAGQEKFSSITKMYFRYAKVAIFVYDVTRLKTLWNMEKWFNIVKKEAPSDVIKVLVGSKCDKENFKQISVNEGKAVADYYGMVFCEVSSKENISVDSVFYLIATMFVELNRGQVLTLQCQSIKKENVRPKVDNKAPLLDVGAYYKSSVLQNNAAILSKIVEQNFQLVQQINIIYRTNGKTDSSRPNSMAQKTTNIESMAHRNRAIYRENLQVLNNLINVKSKIDFKKMNNDEKEHVKMLMLMSKHPEFYEKKNKLKNNIDPLVAHLESLKHIRIEKSRCYLDVKDETDGKQLGRLTIELYDAVVPKTAENFLTLCKRRGNGPGYKGTPFFLIVPGAFCAGGDVEHSIGLGGVSAFAGQRYFEDENFTLSHNAPGVLSMYNNENNENASQFLITFKPLKVLDGRYVAFGRVICGFNTLKLIEDFGFPSGKPKHNIIIEECGDIPKVGITDGHRNS